MITQTHCAHRAVRQQRAGSCEEATRFVSEAFSADLQAQNLYCVVKPTESAGSDDVMLCRYAKLRSQTKVTVRLDRWAKSNVQWSILWARRTAWVNQTQQYSCRNTLRCAVLLSPIFKD
jgi:hypothetical protein